MRIFLTISSENLTVDHDKASPPPPIIIMFIFNTLPLGNLLKEVKRNNMLITLELKRMSANFLNLPTLPLRKNTKFSTLSFIQSLSNVLVSCCSVECQSEIQALKQNNRLICQFATTAVLPTNKLSSPPPAPTLQSNDGLGWLTILLVYNYCNR